MPPGRTVLVIDDDAAFRALVGEFMLRNGWEVFQAAGGDEGIRLAEAHRPTVVLCDLLMARGSGLEVCRTLRRMASVRKAKIVIVSGRGFESDRRAAFEAGADEYLTKPVHPDRLLFLLSRFTPTEQTESEPASATVPPPPLLRLKFWGVRGSIPTPGPTTVQYGGNTSCVEIRAGSQIIILDAGTGLRLLGRALAAEFSDQPLDLTLLLTHTHWDHIQGLPFFLPVYRPQSRLRILGYEGARHSLRKILAGQMQSPFFPVGLQKVPANVRIEELKELEFNLGQVSARACFAHHPGICVGYRLFAPGGSIAYFPDNELRIAKPAELPAAATDPGAEQFVRAENEKLAEFLRNTDVLIMDAQYDREEYAQHVGWGHGCLEEVVAMALQAQVKKLFLFHHDPDHDDAKISQMVAHARQLVSGQNGALQIEAAREGLVVELPGN